MTKGTFMFTKVMLAMDLSEHTDDMLDAFYSLCPDPETEAYILHVVETAEEADPAGSYYKKTHSRLRSYATDIRNAGYDKVEVVWQKERDVLRGIIRAVDKYDVDLLIMVSHGKGLLESTISGSNTFNAVRAVDIPTLIVKETEKESDYLRRVLLPTDFSRKSLLGLDFLRSMREHVGEVVFVHVVERFRSEDQLREQKEVAEDMLQELKGEMRDFGINSRYIISTGVASREICRIAKEEDCSLIFTSKTGAGLVKGLLMGSTAHNIALNSERSLMVTPKYDNDD